jgi:hypothetical protein
MVAFHFNECMVEWHKFHSTHVAKNMALSHSFPLWSMYVGMARIPFHLSNRKGDIITFPSTIVNVWWNGKILLPLRQSRSWHYQTPFHYGRYMVEWHESHST